MPWILGAADRGGRSFRRLERNRPGAAVVHAAVCEPGGRTYVEGGADGADRVSSRRGRRGVEIQCAPLDRIVGELGWRHLAVLSLDVEGSELFVLQATNWSALTVAMAVVEERRVDPKKNVEAARFFEQTLGMRRVLTACWKMGRLCDAYYVQPSFVDVGEVLARRDARGLEPRETQRRPTSIAIAGCSHRTGTARALRELNEPPSGRRRQRGHVSR